VSLSPTATETLFAIGAGKQVQAVDTDSNYPKGLPKKRISALNPSVEAVVGLCKVTKTHPSAKPDLVVISYNANSIQQKLTGLGIKVINQGAPATLKAAYAQITQLGALTGHATKAASIVRSLKSTIARDVASVPAHASQVVTAYYELDAPTYYSLTSGTFVGSLMKSLGIVNIADANSTSADAGYPQLSAEYIISANPNLIFLADTICCHVSASVVAQRTGFSSVSAVVHQHVIGLSDDVASRWGPRLGTLMNQLTAAVKSVLADNALWTK
jgi:iron complex transport system substrate-binding protein